MRGQNMMSYFYSIEQKGSSIPTLQTLILWRVLFNFFRRKTLRLILDSSFAIKAYPETSKVQPFQEEGTNPNLHSFHAQCHSFLLEELKTLNNTTIPAIEIEIYSCVFLGNVKISTSLVLNLQ